LQRHKHFFVFVLLALPLILCGQNTFSLTGGVSHSQLPIYSQKSNIRLINSQASNKLTFSFAYQQRLNNHFNSSVGISYSNLGINSFNQQLDQAEFFLNSVSIEYFRLSYVPKGEIQFGKLTLAAGIGGAISYAISSKIQNYLLVDNSLEFLEKEDSSNKDFDAGIVLNLELRRVIGNGLNLIFLLEKYQGVIDASTIDDSLNELYISSYAMRIGLQFPIKNKRPSLIKN